MGGGESHKIGTLSKMFSSMAKKVKDAGPVEENEQDGDISSSNPVSFTLSSLHVSFPIGY